MKELNCMNCCVWDFKQNLCHCDGEFYRTFKGVGDADDFIKKVMTAVQPKTGRWVREYKEATTLHCSNCDFLTLEIEANNYCPNCGARMRGEEDDSD